tara:strand:+ start:567 stop:1154 length:588 start_codon:yes stop_codon:yes gene_type:complete
MALTLVSGFTAANGDTCDATYLNNFVNTGKVTLATDKLIGRSTAGTGDWQEISCDTYGRAIIAAGSVAAQLTALGIGSSGTLSGLTLASSTRYETVILAISYASTVTLDLSTNNLQTLALTGDITINTSNLAAGRAKQVIVSADSTARNISWPAGWVWIGSSAPASIAASKTAMLTLIPTSTTDASVKAFWSVQL